MRVMIKGVTPISGISNLACDGRFFPVGGDGRLVEVLEQAGDPPMVNIDVENSTTGVKVPTPRPDPDRMGRDSLEAIRKDGRFQIIQLDQVSQASADAAVAMMRQKLQELQADHVDLQLANAQLEAKHEDFERTIEFHKGETEALKIEFAKLQAHASALEDLVGNATAPSIPMTGPAVNTPAVPSGGAAVAPTPPAPAPASTSDTGGAPAPKK